MKIESFFEKFELFADAPGAVAHLRDIVYSVGISAEKWPRESLESVSIKITDGTHQTPRYVETGIPFVSVKDFSGGSLNLSATRYITSEEHNVIYKRCDPKRGDILLGRIGTIGKAVIVDTDVEFSLFVSAAQIRPNTDKILSRYLQIVLNSPFCRAKFDEIKVGGATHTNKLNLKDLRAVTIPLPSIAEQKRIVTKVDELMALCDRLEAQQQERETRHAALARASLARFADAPTPANLNFLFHPSYTISPADLRKSILTLAVQGKLVPQDPNDEPADVFLEEIAQRLGKTKGKRKSSNVAASMDETKPFDLPPGWAWSCFPNLGEFGRGKSKHRPRNDPSLFIDGKHRLVQTGDVARANGTIKTYTGLYNDIGLSQSKMWPAGTLCITIAANIADSGILGFDACFPDSVVGFIPAPPLRYVRYFEYFMRTAKEHLELFAPATAQKNINLGILEQVWIPIPPLAEQRRIVAKVDQLMGLVDALETQLAASRAIAASLLSAIAAEFTNTQVGRVAPPAPAKPVAASPRPNLQKVTVAPAKAAGQESTVSPNPLAGLRKAAGLTQAAVAEAMGLNQAYISQMETGKRPISEEQRSNLLKIFGMMLD